MFGCASWRSFESRRSREVENGGEIITGLVGPEDNSAPRIQSELDGSTWIAIESITSTLCHREMLSQRVLPEFLINPRSRDGDRKGLLYLGDNASLVKANRELTLVIASTLVCKFLSSRVTGDRIRSA
jgi:hypothetical protein